MPYVPKVQPEGVDGLANYRSLLSSGKKVGSTPLPGYDRYWVPGRDWEKRDGHHWLEDWKRHLSVYRCEPIRKYARLEVYLLV